MNLLNKAQVDELFRREAVFLGSGDNVPESRVAELFGADAVNFAKRGKATIGENFNGYGIGDFTLQYLTYKGFQAAASYSNVKQMQRAAVYGKEGEEN